MLASQSILTGAQQLVEAVLVKFLILNLHLLRLLVQQAQSLELAVLLLLLLEFFEAKSELLDLGRLTERVIVLFAGARRLQRSVSFAECVASYGHRLLLWLARIACRIVASNTDIKEGLGAEFGLSTRHDIGKLSCSQTIQVNRFLRFYRREDYR